MPVQVSYPGVYIQEVPSGVRTITGVSTSIALFMGRTDRGIQKQPNRLFSFSDYVRNFGEGSQQSEMAHQVRQFFTNGGTQAYVMRIAHGASEAEVELHNENGNPTLKVTAKEAGLSGAQLRIEIDYDTVAADKTFNLRVFRVIQDGAGGLLEVQQESFLNLTMEQGAARYAPDVVTQQSTLISLAEPGAPVARNAGESVAGRILGNDPDTEVGNVIAGGSDRLRISAGGAVEEINLSGAATLNDVETAINTQISTGAVNVTPQNFGTNNLFRITNQASENVTVEHTGNPGNDFALAMQLGVNQSGIEVGADAERRPAPGGLFFEYGADFANLGNMMVLQQDEITQVTVDGTVIPVDLVTTTTTDIMYQGLVSPAVNSLSNLREKLLVLVQQFNDRATATANFKWALSLQGLRIVLKPIAGNANAGLGTTVSTTPDATLGSAIQTDNIRYYSLGTTGGGNYQGNGITGNDGTKPLLGDYTDAFDIASRKIDLFNLLVLPRDADDAEDRSVLWGPASVFAQRQRAFLLVDPPVSWGSVNVVTSGTPNNIGTLRQGLVKDHAAIYWPRLTIVDPATNLRVNIDPSGSIAGLAARTDGNRGVWKAPAGLEAGIRTVVGLEHALSDAENGVINPLAVNAIRVFPNGIVSWGARTMDGFDNSGNNDYKYVPVRRFALFIEESLYRGLKFAVFEPNDEPLWAQIRLAAGAFMNNLFRQGAFQGQKSSDAYFVKVDSETTTQNDINLGIVNVVVGFAPLKPAEFVVITIQQKAGEIQT
jgi:phage tail sheath protein FI